MRDAQPDQAQDQTQPPSVGVSLPEPPTFFSAGLQTAVVVISALCIIAVMVLSYRAFEANRRSAFDQFNQQQLILARSARGAIETFLSHYISHLNGLCEVPAVQDMESETRAYMKLAYDGVPGVTSLRRLDQNGILRFVYPDTGWRRRLFGNDYSRQPYFRDASESEDIVVTGVVNEEGHRRVRIAKQILHTDADGRMTFNGVVVISFDPDILFEKYISPITSVKTGYAWLMDSHGIIQSHHSPRLIGQHVSTINETVEDKEARAFFDEVVSRMRSGEEGTAEVVSGWNHDRIGKVKKLIAYCPIRMGERFWSVAVCAPVDEVNDLLWDTYINGLWALVIVVFALAAGTLGYVIRLQGCKRMLTWTVQEKTRDLKATRDYLHRLIRYSNSPVVVWGPDGIVNLVNIAFVTMSGRKRNELLGNSIDTFFPGWGAPQFNQKHFCRTDCRELISVECPLRRKDGTMRIGLWTLTDICDVDGCTVVATIAQGQDITERKFVEDSLRESEELYRALFEKTVNPVWAFDTRANCLDLNPAALEFMECSREDFLSGNCRDDVSRHLVPALETSPVDVRQPYMATELSYRIHGKVKILERVVIPLTLSGNPAFFCVGKDVTRSREMEKALKESEERLRRVVENMPVVMGAFDKAGRAIVWNRESERVTGYSAGEMVGNSVRRLLVPDSPCTQKLKQKQKNIGHNYRNLEIRIVSKDRGERILSWSNISGQFPIPGWASWGIGVDITDRIAAETALKKSEKRYRDLYYNAPCAFFSISPLDGSIMRFNAAGVQLLGSEPDVLNRMNFVDIFADGAQGISRIKDVFGCVIHGMPITDVDVELKRKNGTSVWVSMSAVAAFDHQNCRGEILVVAVDINLRKQMESHLYQAQKMKAMATLVGGVAHEINNPVHLIMLNAPLMGKIWEDVKPLVSSDSGNNPKKRYGGLTGEFVINNMERFISDIDMAARRVSKIVGDLRRFSREPDMRRKKLISVNEAVTNALRLIQPVVDNKKIELNVHLENDLMPIRGNLHAVEQVVLNIVINAIEAVPPADGRVGIMTGLTSNGSDVFIRVSDNGPGISPAVREHIFDPFVTAKHDQGGTGLGLSIAYSQVKAHEGRIDYETGSAKGTVFNVYFPLKSKDKLFKILVVDDDDMVRNLIVETLHAESIFQIDAAINGVEACIKLGTERPDLVVLDMYMPEMDGIEVCREIKKNQSLSNTRVLITTAMENDQKVSEAAGLGFNHVCFKPFKIQQLLTIIRSILTDS